MAHHDDPGNARFADRPPALAALIAFYETLTPNAIARFAEFYTADAWFKDPFNEVCGLPAIERIFRHMFKQVAAPRFVVSECLVDGKAAMLVWEFHFAGGEGAATQRIRGVSHLRFAADGRVCYHRDYWDSSEELYMKLPLLGAVLRFLRRRLAA